MRFPSNVKAASPHPQAKITVQVQYCVHKLPFYRPHAVPPRGPRMLRPRMVSALLATAAVSFTAACSDSTGPTTTTTLTTVSPAGNATGVALTAPVVLTFSDSMGQGMEAYMDVHQGTAADGTMAMTCTWSADRTTLTCTHASPFAPGTMSTVHVGAGMKDADGMPVGMGDMMAQMGGVWLTSGMMGGMHAGQPMGSMGPGWMGANGSYGMMFTFTTS